VDEALIQARQQPEKIVILYEDEGTYYRQPSQAWLWASLGRQQPRMHYSQRSNTRVRWVGYLNGVTGAVHGEDMSSVTVKRLSKNLAQLSSWYPAAETIYLVWDNWSNHVHPLPLAALAEQPKVKILWLPTYAPWLNPIEKLWKWIRSRVSHAHPWSDDFLEFKAQLRAELAALAPGSPELLNFVGLSS